ncbi:MAG: efflux RND transporter periplasmic adaptor subunit [Betaproteobacteria bacterium]
MNNAESSRARPANNNNANVNASPRPRRWLPYAGVALLLSLIVAGLWPKATPVETARAVTGPLRTTITEEGKTRIRSRFLVSAPVAGHLRRIVLKAGDGVEAGRTVVAVVDPISAAMLDSRGRASAAARRDAAVANLDRARATQVFAETDLKRFEKLFAGGMVTLREVESARLAASAAAKEKTAAEGVLHQVEAELADFAPGAQAAGKAGRALSEILAPASGRVLRVIEESTRVVAAGAPLLEIGNPADIEAVITVLSRDGATIVPGTPVELEQWGGGKPLQAKVRFVEPAAFTKISALGVEEQRVNVVADILAPADQRLALGDNFRVEGRIITWQTEKALKVPSGALFRRGAGWSTFVVDGGRARLRAVTVGASSGPETQVLDGLKENDEVVIYPGERVHDDERVKPIKVSAS